MVEVTDGHAPPQYTGSKHAMGMSTSNSLGIHRGGGEHALTAARIAGELLSDPAEHGGGALLCSDPSTTILGSAVGLRLVGQFGTDTDGSSAIGCAVVGPG